MPPAMVPTAIHIAVCTSVFAEITSGSMKAIWNNLCAVDLLQSLPQVDGERIGCIGHSLGGHNAMFLGVFDERVKAVVSSCGWTPFHDYYGGKIAGFELRHRAAGFDHAADDLVAGNTGINRRHGALPLVARLM